MNAILFPSGENLAAVSAGVVFVTRVHAAVAKVRRYRSPPKVYSPCAAPSSRADGQASTETRSLAGRSSFSVASAFDASPKGRRRPVDGSRISNARKADG